MMNKSITTIYVSATSKDRACEKSIEDALSVVAIMRKNGETQPVNIKILDEMYNVTKPIVIGNDVSSVVIEPAKKTLISGGIKVNNFKKDTFNGIDCYSADLSEYGELKFTDFYVNGKAAKTPKYPECGTLRAESVEDSSTVLYASSKWFIAKKEDFETINGFSNIEDCIISFNHHWIDEHTPIESIDREKRKITFKYTSRFTVSMELEKCALNYIIENVPQMFGKPNEWYYDRPSKKLYYIPENECKEITGYIPVTDKIFSITGERDKNVQNITIRNFDIAYTKGDYKSLGGVDGVSNGIEYASDPQAVCNAHGGIEIENASFCSIEKCHMHCFGVHCIVIKDGSKNIRIIDNDITDNGAGGIVISGGAAGSDEDTHTYNNTVRNNRILRCGNRYFAACGILMKHTYANVVAHNEIAYLYYTGISCGWVWGYAESISCNNVIEKNHIHHLGMGELSDMGGVYLLGRQPGTVVRNNLIHDIKSKNYGGWAIYTDEGSSCILVENNICYNASDSLYHQHYGMMNTVRNNIFAFGGKYAVMYSRREPHTGIFVKNNIILTAGTPAFVIGYSPEEELGTLKENEPTKSRELVSESNLIYDVKRKETVGLITPEREYTVPEVGDIFGIDTGSVVCDPEFVDYESYDFKLCETSPAYKVGFKDIDVSDVGCRRK